MISEEQQCLPEHLRQGESAFAPGEVRHRRDMLPSPLRYPGGKLWLVDYIEHVLDANALRPRLFVEPFAGGASVALSLLARDKVDTIGLVDRDPLIAAFWDTVFHDADWLIEQVATVDITLERWRRYKAAIPHERRERALACLFLNRTSYSGIINRRSGPIGGQAQTSRYTIDCRFPRDTLIERIKRLSMRSERVAFVMCHAWDEGIAHVSRLQESGALSSDEIFYYLDPPFFKKAERLYTHYFQDDDHRDLRDTLVDLKERWVLSYDAGPEVEDLYGMVDNKVYLHLSYSTATARTERREVRTEAIIAHQQVALPFGIGRSTPQYPVGLQSVRKPTFQASHDDAGHDLITPLPATSWAAASTGQSDSTSVDMESTEQSTPTALLPSGMDE